MSDYVIYSSELYHHGVKGMKWGVHKKKIGVIGGATVKGVAGLHRGISSFNEKRANAIKKNAGSIKSQRSEMLKLTNKKGKSLFTENDIDNMIKSLDGQYQKYERMARKHERFANQLVRELETIKVRDLNRR